MGSGSDMHPEHVPLGIDKARGVVEGTAYEYGSDYQPHIVLRLKIDIERLLRIRHDTCCTPGTFGLVCFTAKTDGVHQMNTPLSLPVHER